MEKPINQPISPEIVPTGDGWAERCAYWQYSRVENRRGGRRPRQLHQPLILTGHGMHLRIDNGALVVRNGFTHYPQKREQWRIFPRDSRMPSRIIVLDGSGSLSFDVLAWLSEQRVPLIRIDWRGNVQTAIGGANGFDPKRAERQHTAQRGGGALAIATDLIHRKIVHSIETLRKALPPSPGRELAIAKLQLDADALARRPAKSISVLLGIEGRVAVAYFKVWQSLPLKWKGLGRHPIPDDWLRVGPRATVARKMAANRSASHPVNAILNYAYAVLESQVRMHLVAEGYDPTIGCLHKHEPDRPALVFDLMEPLRPVVDRKVLELLQVHTFHPADFTLRSDGVCRLNPEMATYVVRNIASIGPAEGLNLAQVRTCGGNRKGSG